MLYIYDQTAAIVGISQKVMGRVLELVTFTR